MASKKYPPEIQERFDLIKSQPCVINNGGCSTGPVDVHHITTRGAGGDNHDWDNIAGLCRLHHVEIHQIGRLTFCMRYSQWRKYLAKIGRTDILEKLNKSKYR